MEAGIFDEAWRRVLHKLDARSRIDWRTAMGDATFASANEGVPTSALAFSKWQFGGLFARKRQLIESAKRMPCPRCRAISGRDPHGSFRIRPLSGRQGSLILAEAE